MFSIRRLFTSVLIAVLPCLSCALADENEPIAFIGHGAFFGPDGRQIEVTQDFIDKAQLYYRSKLLTSTPNDRSASIKELETNAQRILAPSRQDRLLVQNYVLKNIASYSNDPQIGLIKSKINALNNALQTQLPEISVENAPLSQVPIRKFVPDANIKNFFSRQSSILSQDRDLAVTSSVGQKYIDECRANGVPIPPPMNKLDPSGKNGWRSLGFISKNEQFIVGTPAELRVFASDSPAGMCIALPRYIDDSLQEITLDGAICLGQTSSKVCIWDNQMPTAKPDGTTAVEGFLFSTNEMIPIGVPDLKVDPKGRYQAGGAELEFGTGGVCTNCHAGENPFFIHPKANLGAGLLMGRLGKPPLNLPTFPVNRYDPLVGKSWPQNNVSMAESLVPENCSGCHNKDGPGGRLPLLSIELKDGYCAMIARAIERTMPPNNPGSLKDDPQIVSFLKRCEDPPSPQNADSSP